MTDRIIFKSANSAPHAARDALAMVLAHELVVPSEVVYLLAPWASNIVIFDNRIGQFDGLNAEWGRREIRLIEVLLDYYDNLPEAPAWFNKQQRKRLDKQDPALPQAVRIATPPTVGFMVQIVKNTSLASIVGFIELVRAGQLINNSIFQPFLVYLLIAILYFAICFPLSLWSRKLEQRLQFGSRAATPSANAT